MMGKASEFLESTIETLHEELDAFDDVYDQDEAYRQAYRIADEATPVYDSEMLELLKDLPGKFFSASLSSVRVADKHNEVTMRAVMEVLVRDWLEEELVEEAGRYLDVLQEREQATTCSVCGKSAEGEGKRGCTCTCPICGISCFDDVTLPDYGGCYDCRMKQLLRGRTT
jgi:hypothetical protein